MSHLLFLLFSPLHKGPTSKDYFSFPSVGKVNRDVYVPFPEARMTKENWKTKNRNSLGDIFLENNVFLPKEQTILEVSCPQEPYELF